MAFELAPELCRLTPVAQVALDAAAGAMEVGQRRIARIAQEQQAAHLSLAERRTQQHRAHQQLVADPLVRVRRELSEHELVQLIDGLEAVELHEHRVAHPQELIAHDGQRNPAFALRQRRVPGLLQPGQRIGKSRK